jgi:hypothetical protein
LGKEAGFKVVENLGVQIDNHIHDRRVGADVVYHLVKLLVPDFYLDLGLSLLDFKLLLLQILSSLVRLLYGFFEHLEFLRLAGLIIRLRSYLIKDVAQKLLIFGCYV